MQIYDGLAFIMNMNQYRKPTIKDPLKFCVYSQTTLLFLYMSFVRIPVALYIVVVVS